MGCGCEKGLLTDHLRAVTHPPRAEGHLSIDKKALREVLGARPELLSAEGDRVLKGTGRIGANVAIVWRYFTTSVYRSGDLPVLAVREMVQNSVDAIRAAVKARQLRAGKGRFEVRWDEATLTLTVSDNGIGMDQETLLGRFLTLGESGKRGAGENATGGFGVAKAVILGASSTFRWEMHTRDNLAISAGDGSQVEIFEAPMLAGTRLTLFDIERRYAETRWESASGTYVPLLDRLRTVLAGCQLPDVTLVLNGEVIEPRFSPRAGAKLSVRGDWGEGTTAQVKAHKAKPGRGAWWVRLGGLYQFHQAEGQMPLEVVIDLDTSLRPGDAEYPVTAARDGLQRAADDTFHELRETILRENALAGETRDDTIWPPDDAAPVDPDIARVARALLEALGEGAGDLKDLLPEPDPAELLVPPRPRREGIGVRGFEREITWLPEGWNTAPRVRDLLEAVQEAAARHGGGGPGAGVETAEAEAVLRLLEQGLEVTPGEEDTLTEAILGWVDYIKANMPPEAPRRGRGTRIGVAQRSQKKGATANPFGSLGGVRISSKLHKRELRAFRARPQAFLPHLLLWSTTLRRVAGEGRVRVAFRPGLVLDPDLNGLCESGPAGIIIYMNPLSFNEARTPQLPPSLQAYSLAGWLHGVAVHELTHTRDPGGGHNENFAVLREDLGRRTAHLLPELARLTARLLKLKTETEPGCEDVARRLGAELVQARQATRAAERALARAAGDKGAGQGRRPGASPAFYLPSVSLQEALRARNPHLVVYALGGLLLKAPPPGVEPAYLEAFLGRNEESLVHAVAELLEGRA